MACDEGSLRSKSNPTEPRCGDGVAGPDEACDGSDLKKTSCQGLGFDEGSVSCNAQCQLVTVACSMRCGNGKIDPGEACDGKKGPLTCDQWGFKSCTETCTINEQHCVPEPFQSSPTMEMLKGGPTVISDLAPKGYAELIMAVPSMERIETFPYTTEQGLKPGRKLSFGDWPIFPQTGDFDGDGLVDLASLNADGKVIRYRYETSTNRFSREPFQATTCTSAMFVGTAKFNSDNMEDMVTLACPSSSAPITFGAIYVYPGGLSPGVTWETVRANIRHATISDFDKDGLSDILYVKANDATLHVLRSTGNQLVDGTDIPLPFVPERMAAGDFDADGDVDIVCGLNNSLIVLENTGLGFSENATLSSASPTELVAKDFDGDERLDFAWLSGDKIHLRRNQGGFTFTSFEFLTGNGMPVSLSSGDLDSDGDTDLAATYNPQNQETRTYVWVNKAY